MAPSRDRIYGRNPVAEAKRGRRAVHRIWTSADASADELTRLAGSPDHQGIVAEVDPYPYADPTSLLAASDAFVVALDQVQDPRNLGAICRSAEAAGAAGAVICDRRAAAVTAAACKASAGAVEHLPIARVRNLADWIGTAKEAGAWVYGAAGDASQSYLTLDFDGRVVIVLGGEGGGLRRRVAGACDELVAIPTTGRVGSLNVAAAATLLLFAVAEAHSRAESGG
ncbi:MAG: 23S rRNA (guanosine(2251)-2'-O)-methyltransferase RlmB [Acidobacteria bacterium]|nr:MAG: 23S rRNA (guanosine(2251)-2'-O)-methyltransferase RlmB [Acidobacteriota bacterium]MCL4287565.1 23S rRNA (guanosine(2251)-2'-O)-methyltransferase RlmB [Thermoleophilia bacterium]GIK77560.1 MAG: 23S rRNA (guanosine(2251)-2'-O)-methyltransferase RlmB [Actinomycetes bacterium]